MNQPNQIAVSCDAPYPAVNICQKNTMCAQMISPAIRGEHSEMTAITSYIYQHWILSSSHPELSELLKRIAMVEMHHLDLLGNLILQFGELPKFMLDSCSCWSGCAVNYTCDVREMLTNNIKAEEGAAIFYKKHASHMKSQNACAILNRIAMDEMLHAKLFRTYLKKLC